ncbi:MAG: hypothetical protein RIC55_13945 [Pirellulaceae bacterium]
MNRAGDSPDSSKAPAPRAAPLIGDADLRETQDISARLRLSRAGWIVGQGHHRSGWPYAIRCLAPLLADDGVLFDDFVERSFCYSPMRRPYDQPWIGIFHHPPRMPGGGYARLRPQAIFNTDLCRASRPHLKLAISLSHYLAEFLRAELGVPTAVVTHPMETPELCFGEGRYRANADKRVVQVGSFLRNPRAIDALRSPSGFSKAVLGGQGSHGVERIARLNDKQYDRLLAENVVFLQLLDASASNTVIECVVRNTPLVVNRHPAVEEYVGADYPLFYDDLEQAGELLTVERILAGHRHLASLDKRRYAGEHFCRSIAGAVRSAIGHR